MSSSLKHPPGSYNQVVADRVAEIKSPADSYEKYTASHNLAQLALEQLAEVDAQVLETFSLKYYKQRDEHRARAPLGRLIHRKEKAAIEATSQAIGAAHANRNVAKRQKNDAQLYNGMDIEAAAQHYYENQAAYEQEALADAEKAKFATTFGASQTPPAPKQ